MGVRQYIGARYVPKFFENPNNTAEWLANTIYEPLTIVTYGSNCYTSKKAVPASVGDPSNNPDYWVVTGNYNAFIIEINDDITTINDNIDTIEGNIDTIEGNIDAIEGNIDSLEEDTALLNTYLNTSLWHNKKVVVYGDSLSTVTYNYWQYMAAKDPSIDITNRAVGGSRIQQGNELLSAATDLNTFDVIVLAYGTNSWADTSLRNMIGEYKTAFQTIATKAPLAKVVTIAPYYSYSPDYGDSSINDFGIAIYDYCDGIQNITNMFGGICFNLYQLTGVNKYNYTTYIEESSGGKYVHENEILGRRIADILLNVSPSTSHCNGYYFHEVTSTTGLIFIKNPNFTIITSRGSISLTDLANIELPHLAPAFNPYGYCRGNNGEIGLIRMDSTAGTFTVTFANDPTTISAVQIVGINGAYQP